MAEPVFARARQRSLAQLPTTGSSTILVNGVGTGLDLPWAPVSHRYVALDITRAMLVRAVQRRTPLDVRFVEGDSLALPFRDEAFDHAVLHLILAVVPDPVRALRETARVLRKGGSILVLDKFLKRDAHAPLRRLVSPLIGRIATRTDVVFENVIEAVSDLRIEYDAPALGAGWFRQIRLVKA